MTCYKPLTAFQSIKKKDNGKSRVLFKRPNNAHLYKSVELPCGQCIGCRIQRSKHWAARCIHEASLHKNNTFITLTYNPENLPDDGSINVRHFQLFMKKLRKHYPGHKIRFFHCGEYGENLGRPHYHALLFGFKFPDQKFFKEQKNTKYYTSDSLTEIWGKGHCIIGDVTYQSAAYVARYIMKKINGEEKENHYERINPKTGEVLNLTPEYVTMSRRPGIGKKWFDKFKQDVFPEDEIIVNGKKLSPPKFYDNLNEIDNPVYHEVIKQRRQERAKKHKHDNTPERRAVKEKCCKAKLTQLKRNLHEN